MINVTFIASIAMLIVWALGTALEWGGWINALLTGGVFLLLWTMIRRTKGTAS